MSSLRAAAILLGLAACTVDRDGDGVPADLDCNDDNANVSPKLDDPVGDRIDSNCDGIDGVDADGDGIASAASGGLDCADDDGTTIGPDHDGDSIPACLDCDDREREAYPGGEELCDGLDNDCDGTVDRDEDGLGLCTVERYAEASADLLFVVDNSATMVEEQPQIASIAATLVPALDQGSADYHVGVVTTDMLDPAQSGKLVQASGVRWVDPDTPDGEGTLAAMLDVGTSGSAEEKGLDALYAALEFHTVDEGSYNWGFVREDARLEVIFVSDSYDSSTQISLPEGVDYLRTMKWTPDHTRVHAFVGPVDPPCADTFSSGDDYLWMVEQLGGIATPICEPDWSGPLLEIVAEYGDRQHYRLPVAAAQDSLFAVVEPTPYPPFIEYSSSQLTLLDEGRTVRLPEPAGESAFVRISYAPAP